LLTKIMTLQEAQWITQKIENFKILYLTQNLIKLVWNKYYVYTSPIPIILWTLQLSWTGFRGIIEKKKE